MSVCLSVGQAGCLSAYLYDGLFVVPGLSLSGYLLGYLGYLFVWHDLSVQICVILVSGKWNTSAEFALTPMYLIILVFPVCYRTNCSQCTIQKAAISAISTSEASSLDCRGEERRHGGLAEILFAEQAIWQTRHRNILSCGTADPNLEEH